MQLKRFCQNAASYHRLEMFAFRSQTRAKTSTPLFDYVVDHALVQAFPFLNDTLSQLIHILDFPAVNLLLKNAAYVVIDRVEVWTMTTLVGWDEVWYHIRRLKRSTISCVR